MKTLNFEEYKGVKDKIIEFSGKLSEVQEELSNRPYDEDLVYEEKELITKVKFWLKVEHFILHQKARIKWLKEGDINSGFLHALLQARTAQNGIDKLVNEEGDWLNTKDEVEAKVQRFYKNLLGTSRGVLEVVDIVVVRQGPLLSNTHRLSLSARICIAELDLALKAIDSGSAPVIDGMTSSFF